MSEKIDVAKVIVKNSEGLILAVREAESQKWELPGGKIDEKEDRFEAGQRELLEETGLKARDFKDLVRVEVEAEECVNCHILFTEEFQGEASVKDNELDKLKWVKPEEYKELNWHADSGYGIPAVEKMGKYLEKRRNN